MSDLAYLIGYLTRNARSTYSGAETLLRITKLQISYEPPWHAHLPAVQLGPTFEGTTRAAAFAQAVEYAELHYADVRHLWAWEEATPLTGQVRLPCDFVRAPVEGLVVSHQGRSHTVVRVKCQGCGRSCRALQAVGAGKAPLLEWPLPTAPWAALSVLGPGAVRCACPRCVDALALVRAATPTLSTHVTFGAMQRGGR